MYLLNIKNVMKMTIKDLEEKNVYLKMIISNYVLLWEIAIIYWKTKEKGFSNHKKQTNKQTNPSKVKKHKLKDLNLRYWKVSKYIESTIKGCISIISKDYVNKFLKLYQPKQSISNIIYLDASNLYGHSRMQLPLSEILD